MHKKFKYVYALFLLIFLFQDPMTSIIPALSYFDELESLILLFLLVWECLVMRRKNCLDRFQKGYLANFMLIIVVGIVGNIISTYQSAPYIILDVLVYSKFTINLMYGSVILSKINAQKYKDTTWKIVCAASSVLFCLVLHENMFEPRWPYMTDRYGVKSLQLFFSNQTYLALIGIMLLIIHYLLGKGRKNVICFYVMDVLIASSTYRTKALGFVAIAIFIILIAGRKKKITKYNIICIGFAIMILGIAVGYRYLNHYYLSGNKDSLRLMILNGAIRLANKNIPFGTGFGTYCSLGARLNYSSAYDVLGMKDIYQARSMYDNYWGSVIGELGYMGFLLYMLLIARLLMLTLRIRKVNNRRFWACVMVCIYLGIASLGEASFNAFYACPMGLFLGYLYGNSIDSRNIVYLKFLCEEG